ncbi:hypothetical protein [Nocardia vaccinii]|uniref:hypothetical protein n=1 Tax=Nocardia vaccinii TaxID=1822 RepID=UPI001C3FE1EB|nr:hypothetical protein [Nocardia vaccinii]
MKATEWTLSYCMGVAAFGVNDRRLQLLLADPGTAPHAGGVLVVDDSGDRKDGTKTAHLRWE